MPDQQWWRDEAYAGPRRVEGGIQISSTRGQVARTWWSGRFIAMVESLGIGGRLSRGKSYARAGQIVSLDVDAGGAVAQVQGSRPKPYKARIGIPAYGKAEWATITDTLAADASYAATLLAGEMPRGIEDVFAAAGLSLFPATARDLVMDCSCPDFAVPCKHLAAVFYVLAERFDADPFQILALRGRDRETLLDDLRARRAAASPTGSGAAPLTDVLDAFFAAGPGPWTASHAAGLGSASPAGGLGSASPAGGPGSASPAGGPGSASPAGGLGERLVGPPIPSDALLDQVPELPIAVRGGSVRELLRPAYRALGADDV